MHQYKKYRFGIGRSRESASRVVPTKAVKVCASGLLALSGTCAYAQSSVTLYGIVDGGLTYTNNSGGHSVVQASSGGRGSSRWGFRGVEDLGGGTSAVFQLENGFNMMTGTSLQNSREFGRMAMVGLKNRYGQLTMGRQDDVMITYLGSYAASVMFGGALAARAGDLDNGFADYKLNNLVKFTSESFHGLTFGGIYGFGGVAGSMGQGQVWGLGARYASGPFSVGAAYHHINNPAVTYFDGSAAAVSNTAFTNPVSNPIFKGYTSATSMDLYGLGASYNWGRSTLAATVTRTQFNAVKKTTTTPVGDIDPVVSSAEVAYKLMLLPSLSLASAFAYTKAEGAKYEQLSVGVQNFLSKSTSVYLISAWQHASGTNSMGQKAVANLNLLTASTTPNQVALKIGLTHTF
ncbi:porin [Paraburkholderia strydomiana]|uniref:porin n=1 Tax=Paraburkholderia strydomiana TaxID=1245417 RepID=UPI0038BE1668